MSNLSKTEKIAKFLKENQHQRFTTRQIVEHLIAKYPEDYAEKRKLYKDEKTFIQQLMAENSYAHLSPIHHLIQCEKDNVLKLKVFWYEESQNIAPVNTITATENNTLSEKELYPLFIRYLKSEWQLYSLRIDEKTSTSIKGKNANKWLHPDIVAVKLLDQHWNKSVKECLKESSGKNIALLSFEIKKQISLANVRECFFQAVSNSSWANEGYLVATSITQDAKEELKILSALHGIGVIWFDIENPFASRTLFSARQQKDVDWQSVNRIVEVNSDFKKYIQYIHAYYKTGDLIEENWG